MKRRITQKHRVLQLLLRYQGAGVTRNDAAIMLGIHELSTRIAELEAMGCKIERYRFPTKNRFGDRVTGMRYVLQACPPDVRHELEVLTA